MTLKGQIKKTVTSEATKESETHKKEKKNSKRHQQIRQTMQLKEINLKNIDQRKKIPEQGLVIWN